MSTPKSSKFAGIFNQPPEPELPAERVEKPAPTVVIGPALPTAMNFKLSREHSEALRLAQFTTGKTKQQIVAEALDAWIERYTSK